MLKGKPTNKPLVSSSPSFLLYLLLEVTSEEEILKKIRKEKRLYRLLSLLEMSTLELVQLEMYLTFHSEGGDEYL
jgi:hypothetical protein